MQIIEEKSYARMICAQGRMIFALFIFFPLRFHRSVGTRQILFYDAAAI